MKTKILDYIGISAALLCLIHCIIFPFLMIIPLGISHNPLIDLAFLSIGSVVVYRITRNLKSIWLRILFLSAIIMIAISVTMDLIFDQHSDLIYLGAVALITAHIIHYIKHRH